MLQFTKGGWHFDRPIGTFWKMCPLLQLIILFFQPSPLFRLVRIARMGRPGCFTKEHSSWCFLKLMMMDVLVLHHHYHHHHHIIFTSSSWSSNHHIMIIIIIGIIIIIIINLRMHQILCKAARTDHSGNSYQSEKWWWLKE